MRKVELVAAMLAVMLQRSGKTRGRVSDTTLKKVSRRKIVRLAFLQQLTEALEDLGVILRGVDRGGYALVAIKALDGAPSLTANSFPGILDLSLEQLYQELNLSPNDDESE